MTDMVTVPRYATGGWITSLDEHWVRDTGKSPGGSQLGNIINRVLAGAPPAQPVDEAALRAMLAIIINHHWHDRWTAETILECANVPICYALEGMIEVSRLRAPAPHDLTKIEYAKANLARTLNDDFGFWSAPTNAKYRNHVWAAYTQLTEALSSRPTPATEPSDAEVEAARDVVMAGERWEMCSTETMRAALEAAAKVRP